MIIQQVCTAHGTTSSAQISPLTCACEDKTIYSLVGEHMLSCESQGFLDNPHEDQHFFLIRYLQLKLVV
jgi:hypothetical protein